MGLTKISHGLDDSPATLGALAGISPITTADAHKPDFTSCAGHSCTTMCLSIVNVTVKVKFEF